MSTETIDEIHALGVPHDIEIPGPATKAECRQRVRAMVHKIADRDSAHPGIVFLLKGESYDKIITGVKIENGEFWWMFTEGDEIQIQASDNVYMLNYVEKL